MIDHFHTCRYCGNVARCSNVSCTEDDICPDCEEGMLEALELDMHDEDPTSKDVREMIENLFEDRE